LQPNTQTQAYKKQSVQKKRSRTVQQKISSSFGVAGSGTFWRTATVYSYRTLYLINIINMDDLDLIIINTSPLLHPFDASIKPEE